MPFNSIKSVENLPNAARVFHALRSMGYTLNAAVADVLDNSISAGARNIWVYFFRRNDKFTLILEDDGCGMSRSELFEAMRLGSESDYTEKDLGKFGMGLKTASLSQCRKFTVVSRSIHNKQICAFQWNINHIEQTNEWQMLELPERVIKRNSRFAGLKKHPGTVVLWEDMDSIDKELSSYTSTTAANNYVGRVIHDLKLYLRMTYHRFLDESLGKRNTIKIFFNGDLLSPWDPFCRNEEKTKILDPVSFKLGESNQVVLVEPYVLPVREAFSSLKAWEEAKGLLSWNDSQGYYIYRANRLIHVGGWLRTRAKDEHTKYARIAISFPPGLDDEFRIAVQKNKIRLPAGLFDELKTNINPKVIDAAQGPYRYGTGQTDSTKHKKSIKLINKTGNIVIKQKKVEVKANRNGNVVVKNPHGKFTANNLAEALRINLREKFGVQTGILEDGRLWHLICKPDGGFVVILNTEHEFYKSAYCGHENNPALVKFMDAFLFAMSYAELYSASTGSKWIFEEVRDTVSYVLREIANIDNKK